MLFLHKFFLFTLRAIAVVHSVHNELALSHKVTDFKQNFVFFEVFVTEMD